MSKVLEPGKMPLRDKYPVDGRMEYKEVNDAGQLRDPDVSVPRARGAKPAVTATADPLEEPQGCFHTMLGTVFSQAGVEPAMKGRPEGKYLPHCRMARSSLHPRQTTQGSVPHVWKTNELAFGERGAISQIISYLKPPISYFTLHD